MTIKSDLIALLWTVPSVSSNFFSLILCSFKKLEISLVGLGLDIVTFFSDLSFPPLLAHLVQS